MKAAYEMPRVSIEEFAANNTVASCTTYKSVTFDCLRGDQADSKVVLNSTILAGTGNSCSGVAGVFEANFFETSNNYAYAYGTDKHSEDNPLLDIDTGTYTDYTDGEGTRSGMQIKAEEIDGLSFLGWLYICMSNTFTSEEGNPCKGWHTSDDTLYHYVGRNSDYDCDGSSHTMIAPVYGSYSMTYTS